MTHSLVMILIGSGTIDVYYMFGVLWQLLIDFTYWWLRGWIYG